MQLNISNVTNDSNINVESNVSDEHASNYIACSLYDCAMTFQLSNDIYILYIYLQFKLWVCIFIATINIDTTIVVTPLHYSETGNFFQSTLI